MGSIASHCLAPVYPGPLEQSWLGAYKGLSFRLARGWQAAAVGEELNIRRNSSFLSAVLPPAPNCALQDTVMPPKAPLLFDIIKLAWMNVNIGVG